MDIQGHIIDVWIGKTSKEHPIITIYDPENTIRFCLWWQSEVYR